MQLVDVHSHLEWPTFDDIIENVIARSIETGVIGVITSSISLKSAKKVIDLSLQFKNHIFCTLGFAPSETLRKPDTFDDFLGFAEKNQEKIVGIGEIGLDFKEVIDADARKYSENCFIRSIELADKLNKPIVIHCREAEKKTIDILEKYSKSQRIHMHCYSGPIVHIKRCIKNGWFFSIPTSVVDRKSHQNVAKEVPIENMMLETDAPFLSPDKKNKINEPKNIELSAKFIAKLKNIEVEELARITTNNAKNFYSLNI